MIHHSFQTKFYALFMLMGFAMAATSVSAYDRTVLVVNDSSSAIMEFYGSNTGADEWEEDILGVEVLTPGEEVEIDLDDGTGYCMFDFRVVFEDGSEMTEEKFNVCDYGTFTVTD